MEHADWVSQAEALLAALPAAGPPRMAFLRRASAGIGAGAELLLCLSASFNPPTAAHIRLLEEAGRGLPPAEILLLLARANVDKAEEGFPLAKRLALLAGYAAGRPTVSVAAASHGRFVDKAAAIRAHVPEPTRLLFLLGHDTLVRLFDPRYYTDPAAEMAALFGTAEFLAANRHPDPPEAVAAFLARPEVRPFRHRIRSLRLPEAVARMSATEVRARLARGESVAGLVPPEILPLLA